MAPRAAFAESSQAAQRKASRSAPSVREAGALPMSRKRPARPQVEEESKEEDDGLMDVNGEGMTMSDEDEEEGEEDTAELDGDDELFPELDSGSEADGEVDETGDEDEDEDEEADDGEEAGSESGYNSSDIDRLYDAGDLSDEEEDEALEGSSPDTSPSSSRADLTLDDKLSKMIAKNSVKPDDAVGGDERISLAKDGKGRLVKSKFVDGSYKREYEEYEAGYGSESSTEENPNTVGNIPMEWYDDLPHIGYDVNGRKIFRPIKGDELDKFLANVEDPSAWTSVEDKLLQQQVQLTDQELDIIRRLERAENPDKDFDPYQDTIEWFTGKGQERVMPLSAAPEPKRRFVPSKWEHKKVMKIVKAIREGRIIPNRPAAQKPTVYAIWSDNDKPHIEHAMYMPAPQQPPPRTAESYNPPEEYLPSKEEQKEWDETDKEDRKADFLPQKYGALRLVPGYKDLVQERFERCLDLYLAPRTRRVKLNIDPESLIPKLPSPKELRPFPTTSVVQYRHPGSTRVRCVSVSASGEWVASGSEDGVVRLWDLGNGREVWKWNLASGPVQSVDWSPNKDESVLVALVEGKVVVLSPLWLVPPAVAAATMEHTNAGFASSAATTQAGAGKEVKGVEAVKWTRPSEGERERGVLVVVEVPGTPKQVAWHRKGDYFSTVATEAAEIAAANKSVLIHQLSKHATQSPFRKIPGQVQRVQFHPNRPWFFAATQRYVKLYDLAAQSLVRTLQTGAKWLSSMDVHPGGDNVVVGSYDKKLAWFDMDLGNKAYKTLRYHSRALRSVAFHPVLPLFASASDDGTIHIFHAMVYADLMQNPLIVPLKILRGHRVTEGLGVLEIRWHPEKPWLVSSGSDGEVRLWCS